MKLTKERHQCIFSIVLKSPSAQKPQKYQIIAATNILPVQYGFTILDDAKSNKTQ